MAPRSTRPRLVVIVGPTASGKSDLAMRVAKNYAGEIISADSLTVYKDMDIGTAKPSASDQRAVKHWGLDLIGPGQRFTAAEFKKYADEKIDDIQQRDRLPVMVGGTGLYIDAVLFNFGFSTKAVKRDTANPRHLSRTEPRISDSLRKGTLIVGLIPPGEKLRDRIYRRVTSMFEVGLVAETKLLINQYGQESLLSKAKVAYGPVIQFLTGQLDLEEAKDRLKIAHWQYARRQKTWFKRNKFIHWFESADEAYRYLQSQLNT